MIKFGTANNLKLFFPKWLTTLKEKEATNIHEHAIKMYFKY